MAIREMKVTNPLNALKVLSRGRAEWQFLRELVQNGLDADATVIEVDYWTEPETGHKFTRVSDNGHGMSAGELESRLNDLAMPRGTLNFGIGARVTTLEDNPAGVTWVSHRNGQTPAMVKALLERSRAGLHLWPIGDNRQAVVVEPDPGMLHPISAGQGTSVILHGRGRGDTWKEKDAYRMAVYLSRRYHSFANMLGKPVRVSVRSWKQSNNKLLEATAVLLEEEAESRGTVTLAEGTAVDWYVLRPRDERRHSRGRELVRAGITVLHDNELFERDSDHGYRAPLFGLYSTAARSRVTLIIRPTETLNLEQDGLRGRLVCTPHRELPWSEWGRMWRDVMPDEVRAFLPTATAPSLRLEDLLRLFGPDWRQRIARTQRSVAHRSGELLGELVEQESPADAPEPPEATEPDGDKDPSEEPETQQHPAVEKISGERIRRPVNTDAGGQRRGRSGKRAEIPNPRFLDEEEWPQEDAAYAFRYVREVNELLIRRQSPMIVDTAELWQSRRSETPAPLIMQAVLEAFYVELAGKIIHYLDGLEGRPGWANRAHEETLTPEWLTFAALGFHALDQLIVTKLDELARETETLEG